MTDLTNLYGAFDGTGGTGATGGIGIAGMPWYLINTNINAVVGNGYLINATSGNITLTLPSSPIVGQSIGICDAYNKATTSTITIARNGVNIENAAQDLILDLNGISFILSYVDSTIGWKIVSEADNVTNQIPVPLNFRNCIINGNMAIDQRNSGAEVIPTTISYILDRFTLSISVASKIKAQPVVDAPTGFKYSSKFTVASQYLPTSSDYFYFSQRIEDVNIADLNWGTASASPITLSFWIKGSIAGTYSGAISNWGSPKYSYAFNFTVNTVWEKKTITIPGCSLGAWSYLGVGLNLRFNLGCGSTYAGSVDTWQNLDFVGAISTVQFVNQTVGSTLNITGIQLEKGSFATEFEYRPPSVEFGLCQRYYQQISCSVSGYCAGATHQTGGVLTWTPMRVVPTWVRISGPTASSNIYASTPYGTLGPYTISSGYYFIQAAAAGNAYSYNTVFESSGTEI